jgi:hypothetical protein
MGIPIKGVAIKLVATPKKPLINNLPKLLKIQVIITKITLFETFSRDSIIAVIITIINITTNPIYSSFFKK